jgi:TonB-linked SusC/RagA family outer membrane protein
MKKLLQSLFILLIIAGSAIAQNRTITGTVTSKADGIPIPGVSVKVKGTNIGASTNSTGKYSLSVPSSATVLEFSSIGFASLNATIGSSTVVNASLSVDSKELSEVVVTGYGVQKRGEITGSTSSVKGADIAQRPTQSFEQSLGGRAAGVQITVPSGLLNAPPVFRIRGVNSISLSSQPLIVVDGVVVQTGNFSGSAAGGNPLASINPNDIESIDIGKDAAATAIYGSRAANGVVFITTKKGKTGAPRVSYDFYTGWTSPNRLPQTLNARQYTDYKNTAVQNALAINPASYPAATKFNLNQDANGNLIDTDWNDIIYRTGVSQNHSLSISGGSESTKYYLGAGYTDQQGIIRKNDFKRANILLNVDSKINDYLTVGGKVSYSDEKNLAAVSSGSQAGEAYGSAGLGRLALVNAPSVAPYLNNGALNIVGNNLGAMGSVLPGSQAGFFNPAYLLENARSNTFFTHIQSNAYVQVNPFKWLNIRSLYGIDNILTDNDIFQPPLHGDGQTLSGTATGTFAKDRSWTWTNTAQAFQTFGNHNLDVLIGNEQQRRTGLGFGILRQTLSDAAYTNVQAGFTTNNATGQYLGENYLLSYFGRLNYDFNKKYFFSANIRQDEYSSLGKKRGIFYGFSAGWEITKENFWASSGMSDIFSSFKIRGSHGKVGNISGIGDFAANSTYGSSLYGGVPSLVFNSAGNNTLTWETSKKTDVGFNFGVLKERLNVEFAYYRSNIDGLILSVQQAPSTGLPNNILSNVGSMYNKGIELNISGAPVQSGSFTWNSSFNINFNKNEVTALAPGLTQILSLTGSGTTGESPNRTAVGYPVGYLYVARTGGVDPATGRRIFYDQSGRAVTYQHIVPVTSPTTPQWTYLDDGTRANAITQANDAVMYRQTQPKSYGGFDNTFRFKGIDLNVLLTYQFGGYTHYGSNAGLHDQRFWNNEIGVLKHWKNPGDRTEYVKPIYGDNVSYGNTIPLTWNVFSNDFVKLRAITLGYSLPKDAIQRLKLNNARIYVSGNNLAMITPYPGPDPEVSSNGTSSQGQGSDRNTVVNGRTVTLGLNLTF